MNVHDMTEVAYKNGYEAGVKELVKEAQKVAGDRIWISIKELIDIAKGMKG